MKVTIYPHIAKAVLYKDSPHPNPYIDDFVTALSHSEVVTSINPPSKNPLLRILPFNEWGDITFFNWFENIPNYKYGLLQACAAIVYVGALRLCGRKVVNVLHNKQVHSSRYPKLSKWLMGYVIRLSNIIITHSNEGIDYLREKYPRSVSKAHYLNHPTKNRLLKTGSSKIYDFLIWGNIQRYKGVLDFLSYIHSQEEFNPSVVIVGKCSDPLLKEEIIRLCNDKITFQPESITFEDLSHLINETRFVLIPYNPESVLSSGILMDSLSYGAKVIGPDVGSFKDYSTNKALCVYTFKEFSDLPHIYQEHLAEKVNMQDFEQFLDENSWDNFVEKIMNFF